MDVTELLEERAAKDEFFATSHHSPLEHADQHDFEGLAYFEPRSDLVFTVSYELGDGSEVVVPTSDGEERTYRRAGRVRLPIGDEEVELTLYSTGHPGFFIPFRDATSGKSTYGAGRYLDIDDDEDGMVTIDFNRAYNPSCVYNEAYSCPLPPVENWLKVPIEAGEKNYVPPGKGVEAGD